MKVNTRHRPQVKPDDFIAADAKVVEYNPTVEQMYAPQLGPANPFKTQQAAAQKNMFCGFVENTGVSLGNRRNQGNDATDLHENLKMWELLIILLLVVTHLYSSIIFPGIRFPV